MRVARRREGEGEEKTYATHQVLLDVEGAGRGAVLLDSLENLFSIPLANVVSNNDLASVLLYVCNIAQLRPVFVFGSIKRREVGGLEMGTHTLIPSATT